MQLLGIVALVVVAFVLLFTFGVNKEYNRWQYLNGIFLGGAIGNGILLVSMWQRRPWARYVLFVGLLAVMVVSAMFLIFMLGDPNDVGSPGVKLLASGVGLLALAAFWVIFSKRIKYLTTPPGSGG